ncbi:S66 family peptidase [Clostridium algidicarnis]|uniref:S66 family peptidase n=1 Tax=Clostridium algidicarnis TaxID=37659 RepID=UPI001C0D0BA6|nr:S66 peptidase family protein [Clostridium algidicarnis]MBU3204322.1 LD-carboxypeptidase [Clostridium algidicarnis]MBU3212594.1 LD-carboxypeptidase [Clostridium algidicarnis]MBU3223025.1 LD-carboxypeptidase [Clostridium algidicarnis]
MKLKNGDKIGIVACSNGQPLSYKTKIEELLKVITEIGLIPVCSNFIFEKYSVFSGSPKERAKALLKFYPDVEIKAIFDISGGDIANEILEYLDFNLIKNNSKPFFGYSDLTTIINAIYSKTGETSYLYQIRNLIYDNKELQVKWITNSLFYGQKDLFDIKYSFIQGNKMEGVVVGGNIRCLLKLAGTPYLPDFENKILLLEAFGGEVSLITTFFNQLKQMGVFLKINGILLGTFTKMEENNLKPTVEEILINVLNDRQLPIAKTKEIGHGSDSKCIAIGKFISLY